MRRGKRMKLVLTLVVVGAALMSTAILSSAKVPDEAVTCRVELDNDMLPADQLHNAIVKVTLDAGMPPEGRRQRPPVNLSIVLDRSGSMQGSKIEKAKEAAIQALRRLGRDDIFSMVVYNHNVETIVPAQSAANTGWIENRIRNIRATGNTALFGGLSQGAAEIRKNLEPRYIYRVILISDGLANVGPSSPDDLRRLGTALLKEGISVTTIGIGVDYNEDLMTRLSQNSDGNTYFVESVNDLPRIFAAELGDVLSIVAKKVTIIIECPQGVRPVEIIGREGRINGQNVEIFLNQLYGGQEKYALLKVEVSATGADETRSIAVARVSYENAITQKPGSAYAKAGARFTKDEQKVKESGNYDVQKVYFLNQNAVAQDEAIGWADKGRKKEAVSVLKDSIEKLKSFGAENNDAEVLREAEDMSAAVESLEQEGMTKRQRKELRSKSQQLRYQQNYKQ